MFKRLTNASVLLVQRYLPDPFLFCIALTILVFIAAMPLTNQSVMDIVGHWGRGAWNLLAFSMQMALVLVLGNAMAISPPMQKILKALAGLPKTPAGSIVLVTVVSLLACWINWGFGLVVGAIFAKEIAKRGNKVDYRLLIASAYSGFLIWHGGFSGSVPLAVASVNEAVTAQTAGVLTESIPTTMTIFAPFNLFICIGLLIFIPLVNAMMHPAPEQVVTIDPSLLVEKPQEEIRKNTFAEKMESSVLLSLLTVALCVAYLVMHFSARGFEFDLNIVNLVFLMLGVLFHGTPIRYVRAINEAVKGAGGILLQFPFYAGIMGVMVGVSPNSGLTLAGVISSAFVDISNATTFPLLSFLSAGIVNFFVPSGGGQWAVQAPIMMPSGAALGVSPAVTAMSIAWGDAWTNMIQPFWALPALGIAGLGARDIMGFCLIDLLVSGVIICAGFLGAGLLV
ncbi:MAG: short-chain fatty acid transporter [Planctomycetota bacterium]|jgi:short-chain fatty acids transporter|nr:short-chain fatty acid transporter [Planctomycetota bacterium]